MSLELLNEMIDKSPELMTSSTSTASKLLTNRPILLYGAGEWAISYLTRVVPLSANYRPYQVLDKKYEKNNTATEFFSIPATSLSRYKPTSDEKANSAVVIYIGNQRIADAISNELIDYGFSHIINGLDIYESHLCIRDSNIDDPTYFIRKRQILNDIYINLSDNLSREIFYRFFETHIRRKNVPIPFSGLENQYFSDDFERKSDYRRWISLGGEKGGTVKHLLSKSGIIDSLAIFEPDLQNVLDLSAYFNGEKRLKDTSIFLYPVATGEKNSRMPFNFGFGAASRMSDSSGDYVVTIKIDDCCRNFAPTFINMDIEGAELSALIGARQTISDYMPELAISVYHSRSQMLEIYAYIRKTFPKYKRFYLRNYTGFTNETVLYAVL